LQEIEIRLMMRLRFDDGHRLADSPVLQRFSAFNAALALTF